MIIKYKRILNNFSKTLLIIVISLSLSACSLVPIVIGGTALTTISLASDRRGLLAQVEDYTLEFKINNEITKVLKRNNAKNFRVNVKSYNRMVLVTGYVNRLMDMSIVSKIVSNFGNDIILINQLQIRPPDTKYNISKEKFLASKIKASFLKNQEIPSTNISVIVDQKKIFLMGKVTRSEGEKAAYIAANTRGVDHVIKLFEYIENNKINISK